MVPKPMGCLNAVHMDLFFPLSPEVYTWGSSAKDKQDIFYHHMIHYGTISHV